VPLILMEAVMTQQLPQNHQSNASVDVSARTTWLMCSFQEPLQCLRLSRVENLFSSSCNTLKQPQRDIKMQPSSMNVLAMQRWFGCDSFCVTEKEIESPPQKYYVQYLFNNTRIFNMQGFTDTFEIDIFFRKFCQISKVFSREVSISKVFSKILLFRKKCQW